MRSVKWFVAMVASVVAVGSPARVGSAEELINLIPGLYNGDGITLADTGHNAHFTGESIEEFRSLSAAIASNAGNFTFSPSVNSFSYDPVQAVFLPSVDSLGSLVGERAETIGKGKGNVAFSYSRLDYRRFDGEHLHSLTVDLPHIQDCATCTPAQLDDHIVVDMQVDFAQDLMALYGTYGVTDRFDVSMVVPYLINHMDVNSKARLNSGADAAHLFDPTFGDSSRSSAKESKNGFGDIILRGKYNFIRGAPDFVDSAFVVRGQFATGEQDELMGTGHCEFRAVFIFSKTFGMITPHINGGYEYSTGGADFDSWVWAGGFDTRVTERASLGVDIFGQSQNGDGQIPNTIDLAGGGRFNVIDNLVLFGITQFPLVKNNGLRTNMTWTVGLEYTFL